MYSDTIKPKVVQMFQDLSAESREILQQSTSPESAGRAIVL